MKCTAALACIAAVLGLHAPALSESRLFDQVYLAVEGGSVFPVGNLSPPFEPVPDFGIRAGSSYYGLFEAHVLMHAARMTTSSGPGPVWLAAAGVGLEWRGLPVWLPAPGIGISLNYARIAESDDPGNQVVFMRDGESEFGLYPFLAWRIPVRPSWFLSADVRNDVVLSEPKYSRTVSSHIGAGWRWK
ncbi:MAG: hypothetical protein M3Y08_04460 [Fibrobacterota bacterium]|nr:hypothetical protein [Fibrobacterota bacterium]